MKIIAISVLVIIALFFLLPILSGNAPIPKDMSAGEISHFIGDSSHVLGYSIADEYFDIA